MSRGVTLVELLIVLAVMAIGASVAAPAIARLGSPDAERQSAGPLVDLLRSGHQTAIERGARVSIVVDPRSNRYWTQVGRDSLQSGRLDLGQADMVTDRDRLRFTFQANGSAFGDSVFLSAGSTGGTLVMVDPWKGTPVVRE